MNKRNLLLASGIVCLMLFSHIQITEAQNANPEKQTKANTMENSTKEKIEAIITTAGKLIPSYLAMPQNSWSDVNVSICIIDEEGNVHGRLYGKDKVKNRRTYDLAWKKASQVWITGLKTAEFEKKIFNGELQEGDFGIQAPDFIGWEGGQPIVLKDGTKLSVGFSGFSGKSDLDIVQKAIQELGF